LNLTSPENAHHHSQNAKMSVIGSIPISKLRTMAPDLMKSGAFALNFSSYLIMVTNIIINNENVEGC